MAVPRANSPHGSWPAGWAVTHVAETGSTNADLMAHARAGAPHHSVLVADFQTAGKGRLDRTWEAPPGANLLVSLLFRARTARPLHQFTHIVGLAARAACTEVFGVTPEMKWPNDLLVGDAKVAGILAQGGTDFVVVGIGVNIDWAPEGAARLAVDDEFGPLDLLRAMLPKIERLESMSTTELRDEYVRHLATIGRRVRVAMIDGGSLEGVARGVDDDARLEVTRDDGTIARVEVGDVIHLRT